jgi:hypothetical protein
VQLATIRSKHAALVPVFTERSRRVWAATQARAIRYSGIAVLERALVARATIQRGNRELEVDAPLRLHAPAKQRQAASAPPRSTRRCWPFRTPWLSRRPVV